MKKQTSSKGVLSEYRNTEEISKFMFPVETEPKISTMDKPLIIESACPGWQKGGKRFPAIPITIKDQIKEQVDSIRAGAILVHVHPRDPKTGESVEGNHKIYKEIMDGVFDEVGDCVTVFASWNLPPNSDVDFITGTQNLIEMGKGNKYVQASLIASIGYTVRGVRSLLSAEAVAEGVKWFEAHHVKPVYQCFDTYSHMAYKRFLFDTGISTSKPYMVNIQIGKHESHVINRDPWSYMQLITNMSLIKENIPEAVLGVYPGGRNWLPMITMAIIMGADVVRVGVEDGYWLYPHKDELIKKNSDVVKMTVDLANLHGRRIVTSAKEARKILGIKLTSKL